MPRSATDVVATGTRGAVSCGCGSRLGSYIFLLLMLLVFLYCYYYCYCCKLMSSYEFIEILTGIFHCY